ncbi:HAD family hydrolase [Metallumcola ferriviriculae]|uniref:HAD family hydrolase n=1 Tax=Metallumcola ferriviriculae TaxID=3039180 RepID=A0AAU0USH4_9FIRM|nr:HAD family hydrolase [Desulfitibacteraceae bacterium MK1]
MSKAILFDLDGTLLPLNTEEFLKKYFGTVAPYFRDVAAPAEFLKYLLTATEKMLQNDGTVSNEELFMQQFLPAIKQEREVMAPLFETFYRDEFPQLKQYAGYTEQAAEVVQLAVDKGYKIVLATNPVFPEAAIRHRMEWAGVGHFPWALVTAYENTCTCKPNPRYYQEISDKIKVRPAQCLMIGNDVQEDIVSKSLGMTTFLVTKNLIDRGDPTYEPDGRGDLTELKDFLSKF